jgi:hypothetical protein
MKTGTKIAIGVISLIAVGTALYFVFKKKSDAKKDTKFGTGALEPTREDAIETIKDLLIVPSDTKEQNDRFVAILDKMSDEEIDTVEMFAYAMKQKTDPTYFPEQKFMTDDLKARIEVISKKYNIFT